MTAIVSRFVDSSQNLFGRRGRQMKMKHPIKRGRKQECVGTNMQSRQAVIVRRRKNSVSAVIPGPTGFIYVPSPVDTDKASPGKYSMVMSPPSMAERQPINRIIGREQASAVASEGGGAEPLAAWNRQQVGCLCACFLCSPHAKLLNNAAKFA